MNSSMKVGAAKRVITPAVGTPMGGNARLDNFAVGVLQDLYARALWIDADGTTLCILSLDLLGLWESDARNIRDAAASALGIPSSHVMVACTHTHSGPDTLQGFWWNEEKHQRDAQYLDPFWAELPGKVAATASQARAAAEACTGSLGFAANSDIANNRRLRMKSGETRMNWELPPPDDVEQPLGPIDPQVSVISFRGSDGSLVGGIAHYACHPAILAGANMLMSGDFVGAAMSSLEEETGCGAFLFLNGASGNVNHIDYRRPKRGRDKNEVYRCADSLVSSVRTALDSSKVFEPSPVFIRTTDLLMPLRDISAEEIAAARHVLSSYDGRDISLADGIPPEVNAQRTVRLAEAKETGTHPGRFATMRDGKVVLPLQVIRLGEVVLATVPSELFVEYGLQFREKIGMRAALIIGLTNGLAGYIPTEEAFAQGGYEPTLGPNYLTPSAGNQITEELVRLTNQTS